MLLKVYHELTAYFMWEHHCCKANPELKTTSCSIRSGQKNLKERKNIDVNTWDCEEVWITDRYRGHTQWFPSRLVTAGSKGEASYCRQTCSFTSVCVDWAQLPDPNPNDPPTCKRSVVCVSKSRRFVAAQAVLSIQTQIYKYKISAKGKQSYQGRALSAHSFAN